jgi:hypothetical protein
MKRFPTPGLGERVTGERREGEKEVERYSQKERKMRKSNGYRTDEWKEWENKREKGQNAIKV